MYIILIIILSILPNSFTTSQGSIILTIIIRDYCDVVFKVNLGLSSVVTGLFMTNMGFVAQNLLTIFHVNDKACVVSASSTPSSFITPIESHFPVV